MTRLSQWMLIHISCSGADQEHKTDEMHTALMEASMDGHVDVAKLLLDHGAQVLSVYMYMYVCISLDTYCESKLGADSESHTECTSTVPVQKEL